MSDMPRTGSMNEFFGAARRALGGEPMPKTWTSRSPEQLAVFEALDRGITPASGRLDARALDLLEAEGLIEGDGTPGNPLRFTARGREINDLLFKRPSA